jgi:hypothetical protein
VAQSIGEFFVSLGIKGSEKTVSAITATRKGMGELASTSLETKAAILGAVYGLERLMSSSAHMGTALTNSKTLLDVSTRELQQYQYAARQAGSSNEEMVGSFMALQNAMTQIDINKGLPEGLKYIANTIGGLDISKIHNLPHMMQQFQKFAQSAVPAGIKRWALGSVGLSTGTIAGMERGKFDPSILAKAPAYSDGQIEKLDRVNVAWSNLGNKIQMAMGKLTARHGGQFVTDITKVTDQVLKLVEALTRLSEKLKVFQLIGKSFEGWDMALSSINESISTMEDLQTGGEKGQKRQDQLMSNLAVTPQVTASILRDLLPYLIPGFASLPRMSGATSNKTEINQTITHIGDAKDTQAVKNLHKTAIRASEKSQAYRSNPALLKGN